jgi:hypothetical protein
MSDESTHSAVAFPRTERLLRVLLYIGSLGGIVLIAAVVLGLMHLMAPVLAVVLFGVGGLLVMQLLLFWRWQRRVRQLHRLAESNPAVLREQVQQMQKLDPRWLATGAVAGLFLAAAVVAFAIVLLR